MWDGIVLIYINLKEQKEIKKESEMGKIEGYKSGYKPPTLSLGHLYLNRFSHGFLDFFFVQANIRIPFSYLTEYSPR